MKTFFVIISLTVSSFAMAGTPAPPSNKYIAPAYNLSDRIERFITGDGVIDFLSTAAHPFNTFSNYEYSIGYNSARLIIYYTNGTYTDLNVTFDGIFATVNVSNDTEFFPPFASLELLKIMIMQKEQESDDKTVTKAEAYFGKKIEQMNGRQLASVVMTILWNVN